MDENIIPRQALNIAIANLTDNECSQLVEHLRNKDQVVIKLNPKEYPSDNWFLNSISEQRRNNIINAAIEKAYTNVHEEFVINETKE